jgi:hypothetical protein
LNTLSSRVVLEAHIALAQAVAQAVSAREQAFP